MTRQLKRNLTELRRIPACMSQPWGRLARVVSDFAADRRGVVAILFVLALVPIVAAGGATVDLSRAYTVKQRLGNALDAAGLAVGSASGLSDNELNTLAQKYFDANYPAKELGVPATPV
ncbi:MAG: pilus assembly protein, partial [Rhodospirillales bacterium]|nr:pilus assembly protein [Rhodospirillales bacterium]